VGTVLVLTIAVAVGVLVYRLTAGEGGAPAPGDDDVAAWSGGESGPSPTPGTVRAAGRATMEVPEGYIPVSEGTPSWNARLGGAMGLVIAVAIGAIALAASLWAAVSLLARLFADAGGGGGAPTA
jgi:hypothetical protein